MNIYQMCEHKYFSIINSYLDISDIRWFSRHNQDYSKQREKFEIHSVVPTRSGLKLNGNDTQPFFYEYY